MSTLTIKAKNINTIKGIDVYFDSAIICKYYDSEIIVQDIPSGQHTIKVKSGIYSSQAFSIDVLPDKNIQILISKSRTISAILVLIIIFTSLSLYFDSYYPRQLWMISFLPIVIFAFYLGVYGRKKYLIIDSQEL